MNIIFCGIQGSGKGTHSKKLAKLLNIPHISFGDIIKKYLVENPEFVLPYTLEKYNNGILADDALLFKIVDNILPKLTTGFILDGFPRTLNQINYLLDNYNIDICIKLIISDELAKNRMLDRKRSDDTIESINNRINQYHNITEPCFNVFKNNNSLYEINSNDNIDDTFIKILQIVDKIKVNKNII